MQDLIDRLNNDELLPANWQEKFLAKERQQHERTAIDVVNIALDNIGIPDNKMEEKFNEYWINTFETNKETFK